MTSPIWPIETRDGASEPTPQVINHGSDASHHATNLGVDIHAVMHDYWIAIAHKGVPDVGLIGKWESLGDCGVACELQWEHEGTRYNLRYCHGHEHYGTRWSHAAGGSVYVGERIGEVGMTGNTTGPHLHLAAAVGCAPGGLLESGQRYPADTLLMEIIASYEAETPPEEDEMTEYELKQLHAAWTTAEWMERYPYGLMLAEAKAIKNAVRMAKGEAVEQ